MGLDIYLESQAHGAWEQRLNDAYEAGNEALVAELKANEPEGEGDEPSKVNPEHLCNRRYLRSSYNEAGFNQYVAQVLGLPGFYYIFEPALGTSPGETWPHVLTAEHVDALRECAKRAEAVATQLGAAEATYRVSTARGMFGEADHMWSQPPTEEEVLAWFHEERVRFQGKDKDDPWASADYSNAKGTILGSGLTIYAATVGKGYFGPEAMFVYKVDDETALYYVQSALIAAEFCEEAIMLIERDGGCSVTWSG